MSEEAPQTEDTTIDPKDVTLDFLIDDDPGDLQGDHLGEGGSASLEDRGDHPAVAILDMAVKQSGEYLRSQHLPPANNAVYEHFSKPFLNDALWHYLPDGSLPDDPRLALALGVGGLGLAFAPTLIALYHRREEEEKRRAEQEKKKRKQREQKENTTEVGEEEENTGEENRIEEVEPPDWMTRMEGGALPGM